jgi:hypothetical protein
MDVDAEAQARAIGHWRMAMRDALGLASSIVMRGSQSFEGTPAIFLFEAARNAIAELDDHPAMQALASASIPPSVLGNLKAPEKYR